METNWQHNVEGRILSWDTSDYLGVGREICVIPLQSVVLFVSFSHNFCFSLSSVVLCNLIFVPFRRSAVPLFPHIFWPLQKGGF